MNIGGLIKAFDTVMALRDVARRVTGSPAPASSDSGLMPSTGGGIGSQIEARLTNVVMAALKEAFDRDHARLELERSQLEAQRRQLEEDRRRAEEAMRQELRRQAADRELARLRLVAGTALFGWMASVIVFVVRVSAMPTYARAIMVAGWLLLLAALATSFDAQSRAGEEIVSGGDARAAARPGTVAVWLLTAGLAVAAVSLIF
jgi:hypothetical protein